MMDMQEVPGRETEKRALEIAAAGGHTITLDGPAREVSELRNAFPSIGGDVAQIADCNGDLNLRFEPTPKVDRELPCPAEPAALIRLRIEAARRSLPAYVQAQPGVGANELLDRARQRSVVTDINERIIRSIAATIAALGDVGRTPLSPRITWLHVAEALSYIRLESIDA